MISRYRTGVLAVLVGGVLVPGHAGALETPSVQEILAPADSLVTDVTDRLTTTVDRVTGQLPATDTLVPVSPVDTVVPQLPAYEKKRLCRDHAK